MPWVGMFYRINQAKVCCGHSFATDAPADLRSAAEINQLKIDLLANKRPASCDRCWQAEDHGITSLRHQFMAAYPDLDQSLYQEDSQHHLEYLELRIDNQCNFSCRICDPESSTMLAKEVKQHPKVMGWYNLESVDSMQERIQISDLHYQQILDRLDHLKVLQLTGGEPMLIKKFYDLMDLLTERGMAEKLTLFITTNCSMVNPQILLRLSKFKQVGLTASIDAVGPVAEYQRHGTVWPVIERNVSAFLGLDNLHVNFNSTLTAYSILDFANLCSYWADLCEVNDKISFTNNIVASHDHVHPTVLIGALRDRAIDQLQKGLQIIQTRTNKSELADHILGMLTMMTTVDHGDIFPRFVAYTRDFDNLRNESFEHTFGYRLY